jgi:hypothetical protein
MAWQRRGKVRSAALRRKFLNWLNGISIGLRSGEYWGRRRSVAPTFSIASLTLDVPGINEGRSAVGKKIAFRMIAS